MRRLVCKSSANHRQDAHLGGLSGPRICFLIGFFLVLGFRSPCKNLKSYDTPFYGFEQTAGEKEREKEREREREREKKIMPSLMATSLRWRTHSARTN